MFSTIGKTPFRLEKLSLAHMLRAAVRNKATTAQINIQGADFIYTIKV